MQLFIKLISYHYRLIDTNPFSASIQRRQQFYGNVYYHTLMDCEELQPATSSDDSIVAALPIDAFSNLISKCVANGFFLRDDYCNNSGIPSTIQDDPNLYPDQVLVNEYVRNIGIRSHFEDVLAFGPVIVTIR